MQITVTISDKAIKNAVDYFVESNLYDNWDSNVLKRAGVPKKADLVKQIVADEKFIAQFSKEMGKYIDDGDIMYDVCCDLDHSVFNNIEKQCEKAYEAICNEEEAAERKAFEKESAARAKAEQARKEAEEEATVARVIAALKKQGYKIEKA